MKHSGVYGFNKLMYDKENFYVVTDGMDEGSVMDFFKDRHEIEEK